MTAWFSGARTSRPELNRLLQDIRGGRVLRLVIYKLDRLGRSLTHLALILDEINRLKVPLIASSQGIDTSEENPAGNLQRGVPAAMKRGVKLGRPATLKAYSKAIGDLKNKGLGIGSGAVNAMLLVALLVIRLEAVVHDEIFFDSDMVAVAQYYGSGSLAKTRQTHSAHR